MLDPGTQSSRTHSAGNTHRNRHVMIATDQTLASHYETTSRTHGLVEGLESRRVMWLVKETFVQVRICRRNAVSLTASSALDGRDVG
jgi:hypothetical protein